ncbi:LL-diaminopimelate aminotransferase [Nitrospirales bacterium NOB]|nr:MAG: aminotransferase [Nitrospira sp. OLB3]MBV6470076.1 LL-diaminopimelate aminotransferase [Nitrospirota bacterium]MCE7964971.1 LL-diaminopimelate aminotransferase [Nitrospira sp. NTP2]MCK6492945.1 LL-diaminopimelate aminotransferase [Nitrospira sp.]MDL1888751.1 LL-diaminopimelate aminotransferase [Nitrospirales bacterium NOB]MEB2337959.1 LL-diaminopimelate aminotransferase [Nitrospirales bacterium]
MSGFPIEYATRIKTLPPYLFAAIDKMKQDAIARGVDIINLGIGDPDLPTPDPIIESLRQAAGNPKHHQYPSYEGMLSFRRAVADWYQRRFHVTLDPASEVLTLIGSKEGIGHVPLAFIDPGDVVLVPSPGYPVYPVGTAFAGGVSHLMPLTKANGFLPDLNAIPADVAKKAKLMWLNSPNNPTSVVMTKDYFKRVVEFANANRIIVCHDAAYSEIFYDGRPPASFMEVDGAKDVGVEFHSLSKTYNMTGWRLGFVVGNAQVLAGLGKVKSNLDSGAFQAIQEAGITALNLDDTVTDSLRQIYQERRDVLVPGLKKLGLEVDPPPAAFYIWVTVPKGYTSTSFTAHLLEKAGIVTTPGNGFGAPGEGYIRMTVTTPKDRLAEAVERIRKIGF